MYYVARLTVGNVVELAKFNDHDDYEVTYKVKRKCDCPSRTLCKHLDMADYVRKSPNKMGNVFWVENNELFTRRIVDYDLQ